MNMIDDGACLMVDPVSHGLSSTWSGLAVILINVSWLLPDFLLWAVFGIFRCTALRQHMGVCNVQPEVHTWTHENLITKTFNWKHKMIHLLSQFHVLNILIPWVSTHSFVLMSEVLPLNHNILYIYYNTVPCQCESPNSHNHDLR